MNIKVDLELRIKFWTRAITLEVISIYENTKPMGMTKIDYNTKKREGSPGLTPGGLHHLDVRGS